MTSAPLGGGRDDGAPAARQRARWREPRGEFFGPRKQLLRRNDHLRLQLEVQTVRWSRIWPGTKFSDTKSNGTYSYQGGGIDCITVSVS